MTPAPEARDASSTLDPSDRMTQLRADFQGGFARLESQALRSQIRFRTQAGDWAGVREAIEALVALTTDEDEKVELYERLATLCKEQLADSDGALEAVRRASALRPNSLSMLNATLSHYVAAGQWRDVLDALDRLAEAEVEPARRSHYHCAAAAVLRDELDAPEAAMERFEQALDDDWTVAGAFEDLVALATRGEQWRALERAYRRMIGRLPVEGHEALMLSLWERLAELYRTRLHDLNSAVVAMGVAAQLDAGNPARRRAHAELLAVAMVDDPHQHADEAIRAHHALLADEPFRAESYHALFDIYRRTGRTDEACGVAHTLAFLKKATPAEAEYVAWHRREALTMARTRLPEEVLRRHVMHPDQDPHLTAIMGLIAPAVAAWRAVMLPGSIDFNDRIDATTSPDLFSRMTAYVTQVLGVTTPDIYLRLNDMGDLVLMNIERDRQLRPSVVVFRNLLLGKSESHLAFALGRYLLDLYLPHFCFVAIDRSPMALKQVVLACLRGMGLPVEGDTAALDQISREIMGRMPPAAREQLRSVVNRFLATGRNLDVKEWAAASELTAYRTGLLLCGDLNIAAGMISTEQAPMGVGAALTPREKIKELVLYSISEDYFAARRALGLAVAS